VCSVELMMTHCLCVCMCAGCRCLSVHACVHVCVHIVVVCTRPPLIVNEGNFESDDSVHIVCSAEGHYSEFKMGKGSEGS
jgi:hypothetical protein